MDEPTPTPTRKRACDSCYKRKIHCDRALPNCNWCSHHGIECTFDRVSKVSERRRRKRNARDEIAERLARVEDVIAQARKMLQHTKLTNQPSTNQQQPDSFPGSPFNTTSPSAHPDKIHFAGFNLGEVSSYSGVPFFSVDGQKWIESRTGQRANFDKLCLSGPPWQTASHVKPTLLDPMFPPPRATFDLPPRDYAENCLDKYIQSKFTIVFPVLDPVLFRCTLDLAYKVATEPLSLETITAKACVFAFFSLIDLLCEEFDLQNQTLNGDVYALAAQYLLPQVLHGVSVTSLEAVYLLALRETFSGRLQVATLHQSLASRIMFMLRAHTDSGQKIYSEEELSRMPIEFRVKSHLRTLFWLCYSSDVDISLRTRQPPSIDETYSDITLPPGYPSSDFWINPEKPWQPESAPILPRDVRLTILKAKTSKLLFSMESIRKNDAHLLRDIRELDDELEKWRLSLPPPFRPSLSVRPETCVDPAAGLAPERSMQKLFMHIEYHYLMATIHSASSRCRAWTTHKSRDMDGISSSLTLSLEASRSMLYYLRSAHHHLIGEIYWVVVFYPMTAILTVFCHILMEPLDPQTPSDLALLSSTPELFATIRHRHLKGPHVDTHAVDAFLAELIKLCKCAIEKAQVKEPGGGQCTL